MMRCCVSRAGIAALGLPSGGAVVAPGTVSISGGALVVSGGLAKVGAGGLN
jgi:hypothetical protein